MTFKIDVARLRAIYENKSEPENARILAQTFWHALMTCVFIVALLVCASGALELLSVTSPAEATSSITPPKSTSLDRTQLDAILQAFSERQTQFDAAAHSSTSIPDPFN